MQGIYQDKTRTVLSCNRGKVQKVGEIADAPRAGRPDRVQLGCEPPMALGCQAPGGFQPLGRNDQGTFREFPGSIGMQGVPAKGQIAGNGKGRPPCERSVHVPRILPVVALAGLNAVPVLGYRPHTDGCSVRDMDGNVDFATFSRYHRWRQQPPPRRQFRLAKGVLELLRRPGPVSQRGKHAV
ncbi:hypothetical protein D9M72_513270 [compost metagenome]